LFLKVLEYQEYESTFSKYCITTATVLTFLNRNVLHGVMKNVNVNTLENVKGIESQIKSYSFFFTMLLYLTFKKLSEYSENGNSVARWGHGLAHSKDGPAASLSIVSSMVSSLI